MTTALEHALYLEQEKFAAENGGEGNLTPMQRGYMDAMAKLGYDVKMATGPAGAPQAPAAGGGNYSRNQLSAMDPAKRQAMVAAKKKSMQPSYSQRVQQAKGVASNLPAPSPSPFR